MLVMNRMVHDVGLLSVLHSKLYLIKYLIGFCSIFFKRQRFKNPIYKIRLCATEKKST